MNKSEEKQRFDCVVLKITEVLKTDGGEYQQMKVKRNIFDEKILLIRDDYILSRLYRAKRYSRLYVVGKETQFDGDPVVEVELATLTRQ